MYELLKNLSRKHNLTYTCICISKIITFFFSICITFFALTLCSTSFFFFLLYIVFIHVIVHVNSNLHQKQTCSFSKYGVQASLRLQTRNFGTTSFKCAHPHDKQSSCGNLCTKTGGIRSYIERDRDLGKEPQSPKFYSVWLQSLPVCEGCFSLVKSAL